MRNRELCGVALDLSPAEVDQLQHREHEELAAIKTIKTIVSNNRTSVNTKRIISGLL